MKTNNLSNLGMGRAVGLSIGPLALTACCGLAAQTADGAGGPRKPPTTTTASPRPTSGSSVA